MRVLIAGGGTGGHLFPGIAVAEELCARGRHEVVFVGTSRGLEATVVPREGYPLELIDIGGLKGLGPSSWLRALYRIPKAIIQSFRILRRWRPDLVVGVGGYASGPVVLVAAATGTPTAILEQNSVPGITNRILGKLVRTIFCSFEESRAFFPAQKLRLAGNPIRAKVRSAFADAATSPARPAFARKVLLVCGGSLGAHALNVCLTEALALLAQERRAPHVIHQTGKADRQSVAERYRAAGIEAEVSEFLDDMAVAYRQADLVVCRAGATTLAELTAIGKPAILVPFPHATDDHQTKNARALEAVGAAEVVPESEMTARRIADTVARLLADDVERQKCSEASRKLGRPDAAHEIVDALEAIGNRAS